MYAKKLNAQDLFIILKEFKKTWYSGDSIQKLSQDPISILLYNEIQKHSKEDIESVVGDKWGKNIYNQVIDLRNPFIFSGLLKKGAFKNKMTDDSNWLLEQVKTPSLDLYNAIFMSEGSYKFSFMHAIGSYLNKMDTPEKKLVAKNFYDKYKNIQEIDIMAYCFSTVSSEFSGYMLDNMIREGKDINKYGSLLMNKLLPVEDKNNKQFFISAPDITKIEPLLKKGFRFSEENYTFDGETLLTSILRSGREDIVKTILPYLTQGMPKKITLPEQHQLLEQYKKQKDFEEIKLAYNKILNNTFEAMLDKKILLPQTPKIKI